MAENNGFMPTNNHLTRQLKAKKNKILVKYPIPSHNSHSKVPYIPKKKKKKKKTSLPKSRLPIRPKSSHVRPD
jgi:hypothetical protein